MALADKNGNRVAPSAFMEWIQTLPEPKKTDYEAVRQASIAAGEDSDAVIALMDEFAQANEFTPIPD